jgi:hypothetical protein
MKGFFRIIVRMVLPRRTRRARSSEFKFFEHFESFVLFVVNEIDWAWQMIHTKA